MIELVSELMTEDPGRRLSCFEQNAGVLPLRQAQGQNDNQLWNDSRLCSMRLEIRGRLSFGETLRHDGGVEPFAELVGDLVDLFTLVDLDGLVGSVEDDAAVLATGGVGADFFEQFGG